MKKKILLAALFSVTAVLAAIGLATEKSNAKGWYGDDPFWMETGESVGMPNPHDVACETIVKDVWTDEGFGTMRHEVVKSTVIRTAIDCASISTEPCTPSNPC